MHKSIQDYMEWRGDLSFQQVDFCEVDALIFAWLIYYTAEELQAKGIKLPGLTVRQMAEAHEREFGPLKVVDPMKKPFPVDNAELLLRDAARTERFGNTKIEDFAAIAGGASGAQFAAGSYLLDDGRRVVAYRGTDMTVAGWKENCRLAYEERIPAQLLAAAYLEKLMDGKRTIICGHSKGGNLTMYAALNCRPRTEEYLDGIYNFDGPGFSFDWTNSEKYLRLKDRIVTIVPEASIIGMLLNHAEDYGVVTSEMTGFFQHNSFCWHVQRSQFVRSAERTKASLAIERTLTDWLKGLNPSERKEFVKVIFSLFEDLGMTDFRDLMEDTAYKGMQLLKAMANWRPVQKETVCKLIVELLQQCGLTRAAAMVERFIIKGEEIR